MAALCLTSWALSPRLWSDETSGDIENFNRNLGLEGIGSDLANVEQELSHTAEPKSTGITPGGTETAKKSGIRPKPSSAHLAFSNLSFRSDPQVSNVVRNYVQSQLARGNLSNLPSYDVLLHRFDRRFAAYGFSSHNLGDTVAGYLIISWEVLHNADASQTPNGIRRVRDAVCEILERRGKAAHQPDATKQKISELFKSVGEILSEKATLMRQANNPAAEQQILNSIERIGLQLGLDLRRLQLTDQGFVNG